MSPHLEIVDKNGEIVAGSTILPVNATLVVNDKDEVERGQTLVKIPKEGCKIKRYNRRFTSGC